MPLDGLAELKALGNIIQSSIEQIEAVVSANSFIFPSADSTFSLDSDAPHTHPDIQSATSLITSAASQLIARVRPAPLSVMDSSTQVNLGLPRRYRESILMKLGMLQFHVSTAVRTAICTHVAEILRDAGPKVMLCRMTILKLHTTSLDRENTYRKSPSPPRFTLGSWVGIQVFTGINNINNLMRPARILRLLATCHIFTEVSPDVFANNRLSSVLDTGKPVRELLAKYGPRSIHA